MFKERYIVAQIAVDEDGIFWLKYYGDHAEQGGMVRTYAWGPGSENPEPILNWLVDQMEKHREFFVQKIKGEEI